MKKVIITLLVLSAFIVTKSSAQVSATATATAEVVSVISIVKTVDLSFGIVARSNVPGWVQLSPANVRTTTGGATLLAQTGTVTPASFTVSGEGALTYAITLPTSLILTNTTGTGAEVVTVNNFTSLPTVATGGTLTAGTQILTVGAELAMSPNQVSGVYVSGTPFTVTVNYN